jgi:hypothetical protein
MTEGEYISMIDDISVSGSIYFDGNVIVDLKRVLVNIFGGEMGESCSISVNIRTSLGNVLRLSDFIIIQPFDSYSYIV